MRQATIILPRNPRATGFLSTALLQDFGGFTRSDCFGQWRDPETGKLHTDESYRYDVGMEDTPANLAKLRTAARFAGLAAKQICVYLLSPAGDVEFIDCTPANDTKPVFLEDDKLASQIDKEWWDEAEMILQAQGADPR